MIKINEKYHRVFTRYDPMPLTIMAAVEKAIDPNFYSADDWLISSPPYDIVQYGLVEQEDGLEGVIFARYSR